MRHTLIREYRHVYRMLAEARHKVGMTQRDLAQQLRRSPSYISKIESGERRVDVVEFVEIARALRMDPGRLFAKVFG